MSPDEPNDAVDDGWDDGPDEGGDDAGGSEQAASDPSAAASDPAAGTGKRRRRRRRRRRGEGEPQTAQPLAPSQSHARPQQGHSQPSRPPQRQPQPTQRPQQPASRGQRDRHAHDSAGVQIVDDLDALEGDPYAQTKRDIEPPPSSRPASSGPSGPDEDEPTAPAIAWGADDDSPPPVIALPPDLPIEPSAEDPDPLTYPLVDGASAQLGEDVASVVGVRFVAAGRIQWCDAGDADYTVGERVLVDSDRGQRLAWIATPPSRKSVADRGLRRVIRRANDHDLRAERDDDNRGDLLRAAKDKAAELKLPLKVFRVEKSGGKVNIYYTSDERLDVRDFVRDIAQLANARIELRQLGARDEAKVVGGIGSCGLTLCCTTWLPDFVPVSIKMAKDQGLVLSPTKVSGQCGRLKCCLVYEQAGYAELRKGLPKLGKRVISPRGEGRVVEVDVLRQRVRVSYGAGDTEVLPATEVRPMFPSGNQPREPEPPEHEDGPDDELPNA